MDLAKNGQNTPTNGWSPYVLTLARFSVTRVGQQERTARRRRIDATGSTDGATDGPPENRHGHVGRNRQERSHAEARLRASACERSTLVFVRKNCLDLLVFQFSIFFTFFSNFLCYSARSG